MNSSTLYRSPFISSSWVLFVAQSNYAFQVHQVSRSAPVKKTEIRLTELSPAEKYIPAEDPRTKAIMPKAALHQAVSRPESIRPGRVRLILKDDFWRSLSPQSIGADEVYFDVA